MTTIAGMGVDVVDVARFSAAMSRYPKIEGRLFTDTERSDASGDVQRLAARFAAKEAVMKALGSGLGSFAWHDVEVIREPSGQPRLCVRAAAASLARRRGVARWHVSLSHTGTVALATVVAEG